MSVFLQYVAVAPAVTSAALGNIIACSVYMKRSHRNFDLRAFGRARFAEFPNGELLAHTRVAPL